MATTSDPWSDHEGTRLGETWSQDAGSEPVCLEDDGPAMNSRSDGRRAVRRVRNGKRDKALKNDPFRFEGEGVSFKAKLIGSEPVDSARGDRMCQDAMQRLKAAVRASGEHKQRVQLAVSLQGIKVRDDKSGELVFHHPVHKISFISQDTGDARAFGYVCISPEGTHQFIAIKTEKTASQLVIALRDLFQVVLEMKQHEMRLAREEQQHSCRSNQLHGSKSADFSTRGEAQEVLSEEECGSLPEGPEATTTPTVDDLLDLQSELDSLQQGIQQMETTIAAAVTLAAPPAMPDPFDTSFVTDPRPISRAFLSQPVTPVGPAPPLLPPPPPARPASSCSQARPPPLPVERTAEARPHPRSLALLPEPPRTVSLPPTPLPDLFAELDPLGGGRPQRNRADFFRDVKSPPRRVLRDLCRDGSQVSEGPLLEAASSLVSCAWETFEEEGLPPPAFPPPPPPPALASPPICIPVGADEGFCSGSNASSVSPSLPLGTPLPASGDIFSRSRDPFADEFFASPAGGLGSSGGGAQDSILAAQAATSPGVTGLTDNTPWLVPLQEQSISH